MPHEPVVPVCIAFASTGPLVENVVPINGERDCRCHPEHEAKSPRGVVNDRSYLLGLPDTRCGDFTDVIGCWSSSR